MKTGAVKDDLLLQITAYNIDIAAVQETRWTGQQIWDTKDYTIFSSGDVYKRQLFCHVESVAEVF